MNTSILSQVSANDSDSENAFLKSFGKAVALLFLPYLLGFLLQSNTFLRIYIALLIAPNPDAHPVESEKTSKSSSSIIKFPTFGSKWRTISAILGLSTLSVVQFNTNTMLQSPPNSALPVEAPPEFIDVVLGKGAIYIALFFILVLFTTQVSYPGKCVVHRTLNGQYVILRLGGFTAGQPLILIVLLISSIVIFTLLMITGISGTNNSLPIAVFTTAYVAALSSISGVPLRHLIIIYSSLIMVTALVLVKYADMSTFRSEKESVWTSNILESLGFASFLPIAFASVYIGPLIAYMLRFDFSKHCINEPSKKITYESVTYPPQSDTLRTWMNPHQRLGKGIVVPENLPYAFPKPYYTLALTIWSMIRITTLVLCLVKPSFPIKSVYDACVLGMFFEFPIMTLALFIFATTRGETRDLWYYKEKWILNPKPSASTVEEGEPLLANSVEKSDEYLLV